MRLPPKSKKSTRKPSQQKIKNSDSAIIRLFQRPLCNQRTQAVKDFLRLRQAPSTLDRSNIGSCAVDYGTFEQRFRAKRQGKSGSPLEYCRNPKNMKTLRKLAAQSGRPLSDFAGLYCGLVASYRPMTAKWLFERFGARRVLDPCAGWGGRLLGAMAIDAHYMGVDSNIDLRPCYNRLLKALRPHSRSEVRMFYQPAETVAFESLPAYNCICTSPPYDDLEIYPHAPRYENFVDDFLVPVLKRAFDAMQLMGWMCINVPEDLGERCISVFGPPTECHSRKLTGRWPSQANNKTETIFCWKKKIHQPIKLKKKKKIAGEDPNNLKKTTQ